MLRSEPIPETSVPPGRRPDGGRGSRIRRRNAGRLVAGLVPLAMAVAGTAASFAGTAASSDDPDVAGVLTLDRVLALCREHHPELRARSWDRPEGIAAVRQAEALPNPDVVIESEDFGGTGSVSGFDASQQTIALEQRLELGGKRRHRVAAARGAMEIADLEREQIERRLLTEAAFAFHEVQRAGQRLALALESLEMARSALGAEEQRREAGRSAEAALPTHRAAEAAASIEVETARADLALARLRLASSWGDSAARFDSVESPPAALPSLPPLDPLIASVDATPAVRLAECQVRISETGVRQERSAAVPDVTVTLGARWYAEPDDQAFVAGVSLPLPLFDRNRGNIDAAAARLSRAAASLEAARVAAATRIRLAHRRAAAARAEALATRGELVPAAGRGHELVRTGFDLGRSSLFELLAARRAHLEARLRQVEAETAYRQALAELQALTAPAEVGGPVAPTSARP